MSPWHVFWINCYEIIVECFVLKHEVVVVVVDVVILVVVPGYPMTSMLATRFGLPRLGLNHPISHVKSSWVCWTLSIHYIYIYIYKRLVDIVYCMLNLFVRSWLRNCLVNVDHSWKIWKKWGHGTGTEPIFCGNVSNLLPGCLEVAVYFSYMFLNKFQRCLWSRKKPVTNRPTSSAQVRCLLHHELHVGLDGPLRKKKFFEGKEAPWN